MENLPLVNTLESAPQPNLLKGISAALIAGVASLLGWYFLVTLTGYELGIVAWAIGGVIGFAGLKMAGQPDNRLGIACGLCALLAILGGQLFLVLDALSSYSQMDMEGAYESEMAFAHAALQAETDEEIRVLLADYWSYEDDLISPSSIEPEHIALFRGERAYFEEFVAGNPSKEDYEASVRETYSSPEVVTATFFSSFSFFTLLWLIFGVGTAWRISTQVPNS